MDVKARLFFILNFLYYSDPLWNVEEPSKVLVVGQRDACQHPVNVGSAAGIPLEWGAELSLGAHYITLGLP